MSCHSLDNTEDKGENKKHSSGFPVAKLSIFEQISSICVYF